MLSSDDFSNTNSLPVRNMPLPTKMATCGAYKAVLVTVYVEKPRRRVSSNHHHYLHHTIKQQKHGEGAGKGYNRRAELLHYSRRLRESARSAVSTSSLQSKPVPSNEQKPSNKVITVQRKPKYSKTPDCFGNWGIFIPSFLRSLTKHQAKKSVKKTTHGGNNSNKMKTAMKSLQMQKKWRFFSKTISMLHKHR